MALLHRFLRLNDEGETGIFTFIITKTVTRDLHRDVTSKEFIYGHQRWAITFSNHEKSLGVYLIWKNPSDGMTTLVDFSITLLNRDHFSQNQTFHSKSVKFTPDSRIHGSRKFIQLTRLEGRNYMDRNGEFQLEFTLANIRSVYEHKFRVNQSIFNNAPKFGKMETSYYSFGGYDWSLSIYPSGKSESQLGTSDGSTPPNSAAASPNMTVYLNRHTGLDRTCRVKFNMKIGDGDEYRTESGLKDEMSDQDGKSFGWMPRVKFSECMDRGIFKLKVEMVSVNTVSKLEVSIIPASPIGIQLYDKDKLAWELEPDLNGETLRFRLVHKDAKNIPRNHIRYVCWSAYMIKRHPKLASALGSGAGLEGYTAKIPLDQKFYFQYFVQDEIEDGTLMDTKVPVKEVTDPNVGFLVNRKNVNIHIEWLQSFILFQSTYQHYDDITKIQTYQMRQDIQNLKLEKELLEQKIASLEGPPTNSNAFPSEESYSVDNEDDDDDVF